MTTATTIIPEWVAGYVGLPFTPHGRDRSGLDCYGLLRLVMAEQFGIAVPSYADQYLAPANHQEIGALIRGELHGSLWRIISLADAQEGDGLLLRVRGEPAHVGVVVAPPLFLHILRGTEAVVEDYTTLLWNRRVLGVYRHKARA